MTTLKWLPGDIYLESQGVVPYRVTLDELQSIFVDGAPHPDERRDLYAALRLYLARLRRHLHDDAVIWLNGGFGTRKTSAPGDVDIAVLMTARDFEVLCQEPDFWTHHGRVQIKGRPAKTVPSRPFGGMVDAYPVNGDDQDQVYQWASHWTRVKADLSTTTPPAKGFLEVTDW